MSFQITRDDLSSLDDNQQGAIVDAVVCAALADGAVEKAEQFKLETELRKVPWGKSDAQLTEMVKAALGRMKMMKDRNTALIFIATVKNRLPSRGLREKVLFLMGNVTCADGTINKEEMNTLDAFASAFEISKDRCQVIANAVLGR